MWLVGYVNVSHEMDSNLDISPKMPYGCLSAMLLRYRIELYAYEFVIRDFVIKRCVICATPCIPIFCCVWCTLMFLAQTFRKKILHLNFLIQLFIYLSLDTCFLYYKGILTFIFEYIMIQEILCKKWLQNTRTDTRYFRYYPRTMSTLIFPSKIWARNVH